MINVYVDRPGANMLRDYESKSGINPKFDLVIELIDMAALTGYVTYKGDEVDIKICLRYDLGNSSDSEAAHHGVMKNGELTVDEGDEGTISTFYRMAESANKLFADIGEPYDKLDSSMQGVLLASDLRRVITPRFVTGRERPDLICLNLFGMKYMSRPYADEIIESLRLSEMTIDELEAEGENGDTRAIHKLAHGYLDGTDDIEQDPEKAYYWMTKLADTGDSEAMFNSGLMAAKGFGIPRDFAKAVEWMNKAEEAGDETASDVAEKYSKLIEAQVKAEAGDPKAQGEMATGLMEIGGSLYQAGEGNDYIEALKWAHKAADQGNGEGYWDLALAYEHGRGVEEDMPMAIEYYKKGAELGHSGCMHNLGLHYYEGYAVDQNIKAAVDLLEKAGELGYLFAYRNLGQIYEDNPMMFDGDVMAKELECYEKACLLAEDDAEFMKHVAFQYVNIIDDPDVDPDRWVYALERAAYWSSRAEEVAMDYSGAAMLFQAMKEKYEAGEIKPCTSFDDALSALHDEFDDEEFEDDEFEEDDFEEED